MLIKLIDRNFLKIPQGLGRKSRRLTDFKSAHQKITLNKRKQNEADDAMSAAFLCLRWRLTLRVATG